MVSAIDDRAHAPCGVAAVLLLLPPSTPPADSRRLFASFCHQDAKGVSNWSHTGGFVTAIALATVWLPRMEGAVRVPRLVWAAVVAVCLGVLFFSFCVLPLNFYGLCGPASLQTPAAL